MLRILRIVILLLWPSYGLAQEEHFFLQTDKKVCHVKDTLWFRGYLLNDPATPPSKSCYIELYDEVGQLITREMFPIIDRNGYGQLVLPDQPGQYWLRGYTRNGYSEGIVPINVVGQQVPSMLRRLLRPESDSTLMDSTVTVVKSGNLYTISISDSLRGNYSLTVTDTIDTGMATMLAQPMPSSFKRQWDTTGILYSYQLNEFKEKNRKRLKPELLWYAKQDATEISMIPVDSTGMVSFIAKPFLGIGKICYRLQIDGKPAKTNPELMGTFPVFSAPPSSLYQTDTINNTVSYVRILASTPDSLYVPSPEVKKLKAVEIKARWKDRHMALNKQYVLSDEFAAIEHFTFDLRDPINPGRIYSVLEYLQRELPAGWMSSGISPCKEGIQYFVDEQPVSWQTVSTMPLADFAYAKVFQDLHPPCPAICLYRRKGKDVEASPSGIHEIDIKGYTQPLIWSSPDAITLLWEPFVSEKVHQINISAKAFRIVIIGRKLNNEPILFEKVVHADTD